MSKYCYKCGKQIEEENIRLNIPLCVECDKENWITDPEKIMEAINQDPLLKGKIGRIIDINELN